MNLTDEQVNFWKTFGFLHIPEVFQKNDIQFLKEEFDSAYQDHFKITMRKILIQSISKGSTYMVPAFVDRSVSVLKLFLEKNIFSIATQLLGKGTQYWGSDGSLFSYNSVWHRDTATLARRCKFNIYLNSGGENSGAFRIIPGSQHLGDEYTNELGKACAWPEPALLGGFNENKYLPATVSPKISLWQKIFNKSKMVDIPHHIVKFNKGDLLLFDDRAIHCVYSPFMPKPRRLITMLFTESPVVDRVFARDTLNFSAAAVNNEISSLKQFECDQYSVDAYPKKLVDFMNVNGLGSMVSLLKDYKPQVNNSYKGEHKLQQGDFKDFLIKNYR